ncbi:sensor histidine kinase [Chroococcidiopsis thermalis]|uniref:histidine kinase n=1 Tax=Chroococcidiopsis thermalis (strain PCC 7203) TaxID=251229 RepID=K9U952_CHRTP|nr:HAMP domain-containing sensor histidine kinase [Chroococcidiopsis thermalis]AFY91148.1 histidine kinase [Chroococcidiopsis thermalis PCC 7203]
MENIALFRGEDSSKELADILSKDCNVIEFNTVYKFLYLCRHSFTGLLVIDSSFEEDICFAIDTVRKLFTERIPILLVCHPQDLEAINPTQSDIDSFILYPLNRGELRSRIDLLFRFNHFVQDKLQDIRHRDEFFGRIGHDMSNPLVAVNRVLKHLNQGLYGCSLADISSVVESVIENNNALLKFVSSLSSQAYLSALECDYQKVELVDIKEVMTAVAKQTQPLAQTKDLELKVEFASEFISGTSIWAEPTLIWRMAFNLVHNAIKYTNRGCILLSLYNLERDLVLHVEDTGVGIGEEQLRFLIEPVVSIGRQGLRMGLRAIDSIAQVHQASLQVACALEGGTIFFIPFRQNSDCSYGIEKYLMQEHSY